MSENLIDQFEDEIDEEREIIDNVIYPGVSDRVKAAIIDYSLVLPGFMFLITYVFSTFENVPESARMIAILFVIVLYDPIFTSAFGATIGHMIIGIKVTRADNQDKKIIFPLALLRFVLKFLLGWISLLTVGSHKQNMAIHDIVGRSLVVFKTK